MKITQVSPEFVKDNMFNPKLYRVVVCDDGNYGKSHKIARMKSVKAMKVEEIEDSLSGLVGLGCAFILVDDESEV